MGGLARAEGDHVARPGLRWPAVQAVRSGEPGDVSDVPPLAERPADPTARPTKFYDVLSHASCDEGRDVAGRSPRASGTPTSKRLFLIQEVPKRPQEDWLHDRSMIAAKARCVSLVNYRLTVVPSKFRAEALYAALCTPPFINPMMEGSIC
jgi:hypothetical protein